MRFLDTNVVTGVQLASQICYFQKLGNEPCFPNPAGAINYQRLPGADQDIQVIIDAM
jgi:hypothetical protein